MIRASLALLLFVALVATIASGGRTALAVPAMPVPVDVAPIPLQEDTLGDSDDDVVEVQLVVLGIIIGSVFVLGTAAYVLRRRLGLTAYTPPADSGHH